MKIAFLRTNFWFSLKAGGSVSHIAGFTNAINELGHSLFFISTDELAEIDPEKNHTYLIKPIFRRPATLAYLPYNHRFTSRATKILQKERPDFIYKRHRLLDTSGPTLAKKLNIPLILEVNSSEVWTAQHWGRLYLPSLSKQYEQVAFEEADAITVVSEILKRDLVELGVDEDKITVNPNGADPNKFNSNVDGNKIREKYNLQKKFVVGFVGTFGPWHGADLLAESVMPTVKSNKNIHFLLIGEGVLKQKIEAKLKREGAVNYVTFVNTVPHKEVPEYLAACNILVSPHKPLEDSKKFFGSPTKLFEYMAMGKAIVASNLGQIGKVLKNNETAILVEPGNKKELAEGILKLAESKTLREELGKKAREDVIANYTWEKNAERVIEIYEKIKEKGS